MEIWKDIIGYEGCYQISNLGRVKNLERMVRCGYGKERKIKEIILRNRLGCGYLGVGLSKKGKVTTNHIHRFIAIYFIPNPENKPQVNHINGIKTDNCIENLEWVTSSENCIHAFNIGLNHKGENCCHSKLTQNQVDEIKNLLLQKKYKTKKIADLFNISRQSINDIRSNRTWKG